VPWPRRVHLYHALPHPQRHMQRCRVYIFASLRENLFSTNRQRIDANKGAPGAGEDGNSRGGRETYRNKCAIRIGDVWPRDKVESLANPPPPRNNRLDSGQGPRGLLSDTHSAGKHVNAVPIQSFQTACISTHYFTKACRIDPAAKERAKPGTSSTKSLTHRPKRFKTFRHEESSPSPPPMDESCHM